MRLTFLCMAYRMYKKPIGHLYRGKNRKLHKILQSQMLDLKADLEREEQNMMWLRHPYLTIEEEKGHMAHTKVNKKDELHRRWLAEQRSTKKFATPVMITDRLKCLMVSDAWE